MCLSRVDKVLKGCGKTVYVGYKWMYKHKQYYYGACRGDMHPVGEWCSSGATFNKPSGYAPGFHIFPSKEDAKMHWLSTDNYTLVKVEYSGVLAQGVELSGVEDEIESSVVVARHMRIVGVSLRKKRSAAT